MHHKCGLGCLEESAVSLEQATLKLCSTGCVLHVKLKLHACIMLPGLACSGASPDHCCETRVQDAECQICRMTR